MKILLKLFICLYISFLVNILKAQDTVYVSGKIIDENNIPIALLKIEIENNKVLTNSGFTDNDGNFFLMVNRGHYKLIANYFGVKIFEKEIDLYKSMDLETIIVDKSVRLKEVSVISKKKLIEQKPDRFIFNIENLASIPSGDAMDALKLTPRIKIQNDGISLIGKSELGVMVDDKFIHLSGQELIDFLKSISANNIKCIEVITTPPAKYDAEGNSGLINIKMKLLSQNAWKMRVSSFLEQSTYLTGGMKGDINYQKNKLFLTTNLNYTDGSNNPTAENQYFYTNQTWLEDSRERDYTNLKSGRITLKYIPTKRWTIGLQTYIIENSPTIKDYILTKIINTSSRQVDSIIQTNNKTYSESNYYIANAYSDLKLDTLGKKISINIDFLKNKKNKDNNYGSSTSILNQEIVGSDIENQTLNQIVKNYSGALDFELPYDWATITFGGKVSKSEISNDNKYFGFISGNKILDNTQSNIFSYKENTYAIYTSFNFTIGKKLETQIGIRYENIYTDGISVTSNFETKHNYNELFPTCYVSYSLNDDNSFALNYSRRIQKPKYAALNPFKIYSNNYSYRAGNPYLEPEFTHNIELNYVLKNNFCSSFFYSFTNNGYSTLINLDSVTKIRVTKPLNYYKLNEIGLSESYTYQSLHFLESHIQLDIDWNKTISEIKDMPNNEGWGGGCSLYNTFKLNKKVKISTDFDYSFPTTYLNSKNKTAFNTNIGITYNLNNQLQLDLLFTDIFKTNKQRFTNVNNNYISSKHTYYGDDQTLKFSLTYSIGNKKIKNTEIKSGNSEENNRTQ